MFKKFQYMHANTAVKRMSVVLFKNKHLLG